MRVARPVAGWCGGSRSEGADESGDTRRRAVEEPCRGSAVVEDGGSAHSRPADHRDGRRPIIGEGPGPNVPSGAFLRMVHSHKTDYGIYLRSTLELRSGTDRRVRDAKPRLSDGPPPVRRRPAPRSGGIARRRCSQLTTVVVPDPRPASATCERPIRRSPSRRGRCGCFRSEPKRWSGLRTRRRIRDRPRLNRRDK